MLGFSALGELALGQLDRRQPNAVFSLAAGELGFIYDKLLVSGGIYLDGTQLTTSQVNFSIAELDRAPYVINVPEIGTVSVDATTMEASDFIFDLSLHSYFSQIGFPASNFSWNGAEVEEQIQGNLTIDPGVYFYTPEAFDADAQRDVQLSAGEYQLTYPENYLLLTRLFNSGNYDFSVVDLGTISVASKSLLSANFHYTDGVFDASNSVLLDMAGYVYSAANAQFRKGPAQTAPVRGLHVRTLNALSGARMPPRLYVGQTLRLAVRFKTETGVDTDPIVVKLETRSPTGLTRVYTYRIDTNMDQLNIGDYRASFIVDEPGQWFYRWEGVDGVGDIAIVEDVANVMYSEFRLPRYEFRDYWR